MKSRVALPIVTALLAVSLFAGVPLPAQTTSADLAGLWRAKRRFGPDARGTLIVQRTGSAFTADMMGFTVPVSVADKELTFELPNREGGFRGKLQPGGAIRGFWFPGGFGFGFNNTTPVTLEPKGTNRWSAQVEPVEETQTFYLLLTKQPDGALAALLRNTERDYGALLGVRGMVRNGNAVSLVGRRGAQTRDTVIVTGAIDTAQQIITIYFPYRGGSYDFRRDDDDLSGFYPRGKSPARYVYRAPIALDDGWPTASVDEVGIDRAAIERAVQQIIGLSMDSINAPQIHGLLVVRKGKLVLEEYFHGHHREKLHNVRSASKSTTAIIAGAAMLAGAPIKLSSPVYQLMNGGAFPPDLEPRKRALTLEHLLTMSSGYFCDDNNEDAPGREDHMWEQEEPDFYKFTLKLPMAYAPGEKAIYCSINPNLALGMVGVAARESPFYLFDRLVAAPMGITYYLWALDRVRHPYGGGGSAYKLRDFSKFGQLMLNGGIWHGRRILSADFVARAISPLAKINGQRDYGLAWWPQEYPYVNGTVHAFSALGAGGNLVMVFPELDLVVATFGGSYSSRGWRYIGGEFITNYILPSVTLTPRN
jgi:CubicO group peptidase (beta-lactamase class C family)